VPGFRREHQQLLQHPPDQLPLLDAGRGGHEAGSIDIGG
jgi:hypothetical protein